MKSSPIRCTAGSGATRPGRSRRPKPLLLVPWSKGVSNSEYRVAIIGGGVAGLTAAYELARQGVLVTLYEKEQ
ncbi:MAG: FAD-dependent oxidoreductase, partial [Anaerolineae bacterium]